MNISISATNPCHVYHMALELQQADELGAYYSGYPRWRLPGSESLECRTHTLRTLAVYGLLRLPEWARPKPRDLFLWQDGGFDRWVGSHLEPCDFIHALPGQCRETFRRAKDLGICRVLNHATGPVREWVEIMRPEYQRVGLDVTQVTPYDDAYFAREEEEYALADIHCAASSVVKEQLVKQGVDADTIWVVPYGADLEIFHPRGARRDGPFRIVFAGQFGVRKGVHTLLRALETAGTSDWQVDVYGTVLGESKQDLASYTGAAQLNFHGAVSQSELAEAFRSASALVLPSVEEGFGLVVPQALGCGLPCIVSDRVGAKDLVSHHQNGSIFPTGSAEALADELLWWHENPAVLQESYTWKEPAQKLISLSRERLNSD